MNSDEELVDALIKAAGARAGQVIPVRDCTLGALMETLRDMIEDAELNAIADERSGGPAIAVDLGDL